MLGFGACMQVLGVRAVNVAAASGSLLMLGGIGATFRWSGPFKGTVQVGHGTDMSCTAFRNMTPHLSYLTLNCQHKHAYVAPR